jgi:FixJ family two-component response regulator
MGAMSPTAKVHVVDDDAPVRVALTRLLRSAGHEVATYESAEALLAAADRGLTGCVLLDLNLPGANGLQLQEQLASHGCHVHIVFLTGHGDVAAGVRAMKQGAVDFLEKPVDDDTLLAAVGAALERDSVARRERADLDELRARVERLTEREREVWLEVVRGRLNKQIAGDLGIVERTVKAHRAKVMEKLRADSAAELVRMASRLGLGPTD